MNSKPIIFALANPDPEISEKDAIEGGAEIYASGRSDQKNQINNSLVFPGIFRAINEHNLREITE
jgi:malate dehydrogenase (oxaloacetate-decarboxylating)